MPKWLTRTFNACVPGAERVVTTTASRILLTGAGGFVGRRLARALVHEAPEARRVALLRDGGEGAEPGWEAAIADVTDTNAMNTLVEDFAPDLVLHLAAQASVGAARGDAEETWRVNCGGALVVAGALARHAPDAAVLFTSTSEVYGAAFREGPVDEDTEPRPRNPYARSKLAAEEVLADVLPDTARLIVARAFNHSGSGQDERFVLPSFAAQIARIEAGLAPPQIQVGNLDAERDFLHVDDVVAAYLALARNLSDLPLRGLVNVASGTAHRIGDLLDRMLAQARIPIEIAQDPDRLRPSDIPSASARPERLVAWTGWGKRNGVDDLVLEVLRDARSRV